MNSNRLVFCFCINLKKVNYLLAETNSPRHFLIRYFTDGNCAGLRVVPPVSRAERGQGSGKRARLNGWNGDAETRMRTENETPKEPGQNNSAHLCFTFPPNILSLLCFPWCQAHISRPSAYYIYIFLECLKGRQNFPAFLAKQLKVVGKIISCLRNQGNGKVK